MIKSFLSYDFKNHTLDVIQEALDTRNFYSPLSTSKVFQKANEGAKINGERLSDILPKMVVADQGFTQIVPERLSKEMLYELFDSRSFKFTNKSKVKDAIFNKEIVLVYSEKYKVPASIPYIVRATNPPTIYVNVANYTKMSDHGVLDVLPRQESSLMALLYSAYISLHYLKPNVNPGRSELKTFAMTYGNMFGNIVGYNAGISDPIMLNKIKYLGTKFYLIQLMGTGEGDDYMYRIMKPYFEDRLSSKQVVEMLDEQFPLDCFDNIELLFLEILKNYPNIKNLSLAPFMEAWIKRYGISSVMAADYPGYMLYIIVSVLLGAPSVNIRSLDNVVDKDIANAYKNMQII